MTQLPDNLDDAPARPRTVDEFMHALAERPLPRPREAPRRSLLRRARIESTLQAQRARAAVGILPARIIEVCTYVAVAIATTTWAGASWGELRVSPATRWLGALPDHVQLAPGVELPLSLTTLAAMCAAALLCLAWRD